MSIFSTVTGARLIKALRQSGFEVLRIRGSHRFLQHLDGRCTVVPVHSGEAIGKGLLAKILKDCDLNRKDLQRLLK